jgi:hypothetical protein
MKATVPNYRVEWSGRPLGDISDRLRIDVPVEHQHVAFSFSNHLSDKIRSAGIEVDFAD